MHNKNCKNENPNLIIWKNAMKKLLQARYLTKDQIWWETMKETTQLQHENQTGMGALNSIIKESQEWDERYQHMQDLVIERNGMNN